MKYSLPLLKTELLPNGGAFAYLEEARLEVAHYLDTYFDSDRPVHTNRETALV